MQTNIKETNIQENIITDHAKHNHSNQAHRKELKKNSSHWKQHSDSIVRPDLKETLENEKW